MGVKNLSEILPSDLTMGFRKRFRSAVKFEEVMKLLSATSCGVSGLVSFLSKNVASHGE